MRKFNALKANYPTALIFMLLCAAAIGCLQYLTPWQGDDHIYGLVCRDASTGETGHITWQRGWAFVCAHYFGINGRIGDKLILWLLADVPKWCIAFISGVAAMSMFYFGSLTAFGSIRKHPLKSCVLTGAIICCMPWFVSMFLTNMVLNYLWGTGIAAIIVWFFVRPRKLSMAGNIGIFILSFIVSGWHEACSLPLLGGGIIFMLINRHNNPRIRYIIMIGILAGVLFTLTSPGFWLRKNMLEHNDNIITQPLGIMLRGIIGGINIGLIVWIIPLLAGIRKWRESIGRLTLAFGCMACVGMAIAIGIYFATYYTLRVFWYADMLALIAIGMLFAQLAAPLPVVLRRISGYAIMLFVVLHLWVSIDRQHRIAAEYEDIIGEYAASEDGTVFYDYSGYGYGSPLNLRKAQIFALNTEYRYGYNYITEFYRNDSLAISIVPTELRDFDMKRWPKGKNVAIFNGLAVSNDTSLTHTEERIIHPFYHYADGRAGAVRTLLNPFRAKDGTQLYYFEIDVRIADNQGIVSAEL